MLRFTHGDLLNSDAEAIVNTVNCVGIMGRGIALQFKQMYPANFKSYAAACNAGLVVPGRMFVYETGEMTNPKYIINFPTKKHWRGNSKLEDIESGLAALREEIQKRGIRSVAIPPLGTGLGGLPWPAVRSRMIDALSDLQDVEIIVYEPRLDSDRMARHERKQPPKLTPYRAALVQLMDRYVRGLMEPYVTLLEIHKLVYFLQHAGLNMRLKFVKGHYGPYAENLRHVMSDMEGYYTAGYGDGGDQPFKRISVVPTATDQALELLKNEPSTESTFNRISELIDGFETPLGLELLATTHWAYTQGNRRSIGDIRNYYCAWNARKSEFTEHQIAVALDRLRSTGWLSN